MQHKNGNFSFFEKLRPIQRTVLGALTAVIIFLFISKTIPLLLKIVFCWIGFCFTYVVCCWLVINSMKVEGIKIKANKEDGSKAFVFGLIIAASVASLFAVLVLVMDKDEIKDALLIPASFGAMIISWVLVHTIYVFHYAHLYYQEGKKGKGIDFPGDEPPDYWDFAYFSFVMGCTFQVSDVEISSKEIRRVALFHGLLSFALNAFVVALTINIIAGLSN